MSESIENIVLLEANLSNLKSLINKLRDENLEFSKDLRLKDESLKIANTFLGSDDKSLTKLKINNLIKELDKCILSLSS